MAYINNKLVEFENFIRYRKVAVIGIGVSNIPLLKYLHDKKANVTVFDCNEIDKISKDVLNEITSYNFEFSFGKNYLSKLKGFTLIFRSPSCLPTTPELIQEKNRGAIITSEVELLLEMTPCTTIGVTGSDGKTTTTSLIYSIVEKAGYKTYLGGNIGVPLFTKLSEMTPDDILILELSSFQLMGMEISPHIAVITNITPNHLNIHKDYEEYIDSKKNIFKYQNENDILILNYDNEITRNCAKEANGKVIYFSSKEKLDNGYILDEKIIKECEDGIRKHIIDTKDVVLRGTHNFENICTALAATNTLVDTDTAVSAIENFTPVEHRLEFVKEINNVKWYNDSVSSSPTRTIAGLNSFDEEIVLIAGGYDKNLDYTPIAKPIIENVKTLILLGQTSEKIYNAVTEEAKKQDKKIDIRICENLQEAVKTAKRLALKGQIVLFSPASASFDMFKNFADRGNKFKDEVNNL